MGYTTDFKGKITLTQEQEPLSDSQEYNVNENLTLKGVFNLVNGLGKTRRMARDLSRISDEDGLINGIHWSKYGEDGEFYFNSNSNQFGQEEDDSILNFNSHSPLQPGLWLQWQIRKMKDQKDNECFLKWDGGEKFYAYTEWLNYLNNKIFIPNNISLHGAIHWYGEDRSDFGTIIALGNKIYVLDSQIADFDHFSKTIIRVPAEPESL